MALVPLELQGILQLPAAHLREATDQAHALHTGDAQVHVREHAPGTQAGMR